MSVGSDLALELHKTRTQAEMRGQISGVYIITHNPDTPHLEKGQANVSMKLKVMSTIQVRSLLFKKFGFYSHLAL